MSSFKFNPNMNLNRKSFRQRKVDNKKPMRIMLQHEISEEDMLPVSRAGVDVETGVEKEEEEEIHLVTALEKRQQGIEEGYGTSIGEGEPAIPCPDSDANKRHLFPPNWKMSHTFLKFSTPILECVGCLYNMDEDDEGWLSKYNKDGNNNLSEDDFEEIMEFFENQAKNKPHLLVYTHWKTKRQQRMIRYKTVAPLMFELKTADTKDEEDNPYVCFRRRELKPMRRTRRTETQSFDKLRRIRRDVHNGREIIVKVKSRERFKKQRIELNRKIFIKECDIKEMRKELGIQNNVSDSQQRNKNRKISISHMDAIGSLRTKSGTKSSKKDKESSGIHIDVTHASINAFMKFDADKLSVLPPAFRSRYGRGGRKRRTIDRLDVFTIYRMKRPKNNNFKYDSDEMEDVYSDDDMDSDEIDDNSNMTEWSIKFHFLKDEDFQSLGAFRNNKVQKDKQSSPRQCSRDDGQVGISTQNHSQNSAQANIDPRVSISASQSRSNSEVRSNSEPRAEGSSSRGNPDTRITIDMDSSRPNILPRTVVDQRSVRPNYDSNITSRTDPRFSDLNFSRDANQSSAQISQRANPAISISITNREQHLSSDVNVSRDQILNTVSLTGRDQRLPVEQNQSSDQRLLTESRPNLDPRVNLSHNGHAVRTSISLNHRDATPYRRPIQRNVRMSEDSTNTNGIAGISLVQTPRMTSPLQGSATGIVPTNVHINGHSSVIPLSQITPQITTRQLSGNSQANATSTINGVELTRTSSNPGIIMNNTTPVLTRTPSNPGMMVNSVTPGLSRTPSNPGIIMNGTSPRLTRTHSNSGIIINTATPVIDPRRLQRTPSTQEGIMMNITSPLSRTSSNSGMIINNSVSLIDKISNGAALVNSGHRIAIANGGQPTFTNGSPGAPSQQATHLNVQSTRPHLNINNSRGLSNEQFVHSSDQNNNIQMLQRTIYALRTQQPELTQTQSQDQTQNQTQSQIQISPNVSTNNQTQTNNSTMRQSIAMSRGTLGTLGTLVRASNAVTPSTASANQTPIQTIIVPSVGSNGQSNSSSQQIQNNGTNNIVQTNGSSNLRQGNVQTNGSTGQILRHTMNVPIVANGYQSAVVSSAVVGNRFPLSARYVDRDSLQQAFGILSDPSVQQVNSATNPNIRQTNIMSPNGQNNVNSMRQSFLMSNGAVSVASNMAQINQRPIVLSNGTAFVGNNVISANGVSNLNVRQMQANLNLRPMTQNGIRQVHSNGASSQGLRQNIVVPTNGFMNASPVQLSSNVSISNMRQPNIPSQASPTRDSTNGL
ncbi:10767_t:CDS:2 [Dentiscutata erythropus]|uniref:Enhancer of polycomb-like protein n=1 Tax=Dentiscutata erythropus TaxID=1348616 RepID=A0A9N9F2H7_9GLOM|nr:10767_t:CDS:2 [Dentiscutata erythropus]